ncbi:flagellar hook-length control protein [Mycolicibacterium litorale]|nr:flagellar hook-length control protein [Mycolicibacterium litorale]
MTTDEDAITAALAVAEDIAEGRLDPAELAAVAAAEARAAFGRVVGEGDEMWELHVDVARQCLAVGGWITSDELAEWVAVYRAAEGPPPAPQSWIEQALAASADEDGDDDE